MNEDVVIVISLVLVVVAPMLILAAVLGPRLDARVDALFGPLTQVNYRAKHHASQRRR